jgi:hypothetical protein
VSGTLLSFQPATSPRFRFYTSDELAELPPATWLVENIFEVDSQVMLYGLSGDGKSFAALDLALSVATGQDWHGHKVKQGPVVYIVAEGGRGITRRIAAWRKANNWTEPLEAFFTLQAPQLTDLKNLGTLIADIRQHTNPVLIIFDTFARTFAGKEENSSKDTGEWIAAAATVQAAFKTTVLTVHHSGKRKGKRPPPERGSSALRGAMDTIIRVSKSGMAVTVICEKQKDEEEFEKIGLTLDIIDLGSGVTSCVLSDGVAEGQGNVGLTSDHYRLLTALASHPSTPTPVADWRTSVDADGKGPVPERTFDRWRGQCMPEYVESPKKGFYQLTAIGLAAIAKHPPSTATAGNPPTAATATTP